MVVTPSRSKRRATAPKSHIAGNVIYVAFRRAARKPPRMADRLAQGAVTAGEIGTIFFEHIANAAGFGFSGTLGLGTGFGFYGGFGGAGRRRSACCLLRHSGWVSVPGPGAS